MMVCRSCGNEERASEGYPCDVCGTFKFVHVWRRTANGWQITRAVSYDH